MKDALIIYGRRKPRTCKECPMKYVPYHMIKSHIDNSEYTFRCIWTKDILNLSEKVRPHNCPTRKPKK